MADVGDIHQGAHPSRIPKTDRNSKEISDQVDSPSSRKDDSLTWPMSYKMDHRKRGFFIVFNHKSFDKVLNCNDREGTEADVKSLQYSWERLGFEVKIYHNYSLKQIKQKIQKYSEMDHSGSDCFGCAVLTHGDKGDLLYARDQAYEISTLISPFRDCDSLLQKPKLFFVQSCRGTKLDDGKRITESDMTDTGPIRDEEFPPSKDQEIVIPSESDFLISYSTVSGYYAWRSTVKGKEGSWFIQTLTECLDKFGTELELIQILTMVNRHVGRRASITQDELSHGKKQMPSIVSRLTKLVFFPPIAASPEVNIKRESLSEPDMANKTLGSREQSATSSVFEQQETNEEHNSDRSEYYKKKLQAINKKQELLALEKEIYRMKLKATKKVIFE